MYLLSFGLRFGGVFFVCLGRHLLFFFSFLIPIDIYHRSVCPYPNVALDISCRHIWVRVIPVLTWETTNWMWFFISITMIINFKNHSDEY